mmetsp:Transcript_39255/g.65943  ORF Transcript_39255/g.65943 Transcript_39255/m.65943 type:complete len:406 (+) Transcript_39255:751-1968(+)
MHGRDVGEDVISKFTTFLHTKCLAGVFATERGGKLHYLHIQAVLRIDTKCAGNVTKMLNKLFGWNKNDPACPKTGTSICAKKLTNKGLHTWHGMQGYVTKEDGKAHYRMVKTANITEQDLKEGRRRYLMLGAGPLKGRAALSPRNLLIKAHLYHHMNMNAKYHGKSLAYTIMKMIRTGNFYPCMSWIVRFQGGGLVYERADTVWRMLLDPTATTKEDVKQVFFHSDEQERFRYTNPRSKMPFPMGTESSSEDDDSAEVELRQLDLEARMDKRDGTRQANLPNPDDAGVQFHEVPGLTTDIPFSAMTQDEHEDLLASATGVHRELIEEKLAEEFPARLLEIEGYDMVDVNRVLRRQLMRSVQQREDVPEEERLDCILRSVLESTSKTHIGGGDTSSRGSDDLEYDV